MVRGQNRGYCQRDTSSSKERTVICAQAQDESESKSADIKWGLQKSFVDPDSKYYQRKCYGYRHNEKGQLVINENEAEVVKLIFRMSKEGASLSKIAQTLQDQGILSPRGKAVWSRETLRKILHNEKYRGIVILQKTFVANCLNHRQVKNIGQCDQYQIISNHKPIIHKNSSWFNSIPNNRSRIIHNW